MKRNNAPQMMQLLMTLALCIFSFSMNCAQGETFHSSTSHIEIDAKQFCHPLSEVALCAATKYHGHYIVMFNEQLHDGTSFEIFLHILAISTADHSIKTIKTDIDGHFDMDSRDEMFVRNDSLLIKSRFDNGNNYYIETSGDEWLMKKIPAVSEQAYEDDTYRVNYTDHGEFGQYLSFIEKENQVEHAYHSKGDRVFKMPDGYYVCGRYGVSFISDPSEGSVINIRDMREYPASVPAQRYDILKGRRGTFGLGPKIDTAYHAAFVHNGKIHLLASNSHDTYIERFDGKNVHKVWSMGRKLSSQVNSSIYDRNRQNDGALCWYNGTKNHCGIVDIERDSIRITRLTLKRDTILYTNQNTVKKTLKHFLPKLKTSTLADATAFEEQNGGITNGLFQSCHVQDVSKPNLQEMRYYHLIDRRLTQITTYGFDKESRVIDYIVIEWLNTQALLNGGFNKINEKRLSQQMINTVSQMLGKPKTSNEERVWHNNGLKIALWNTMPLLIVSPK